MAMLSETMYTAYVLVCFVVFCYRSIVTTFARDTELVWGNNTIARVPMNQPEEW